MDGAATGLVVEEAERGSCLGGAGPGAETEEDGQGLGKECGRGREVTDVSPLEVDKGAHQEDPTKLVGQPNGFGVATSLVKRFKGGVPLAAEGAHERGGLVGHAQEQGAI